MKDQLEYSQERPYSILVVDDEPGFRDMLKWHLDALGVEVATAQDGEEAMKHAAKGNVLLVITDLTMPRLNGLELLSKLKERNPGMEVVILTGFGSVETAVSAMKRGAADFILKPFDLDSFLKVIKGILGKFKDERPGGAQ
ncbi:MAG: hypothetical protein A3A86_05420 [Elusimicrobia bacterium RIFCSPLOWO2_01_FULL_60_11]|nr:MAG: hypothetical protein A3A86_05420 [Elusimicrobia bacterium RIFCSPLOWO2_01_FULL_60_11]